MLVLDEHAVTGRGEHRADGDGDEPTLHFHPTRLHDRRHFCERGTAATGASDMLAAEAS